MNITIYTVGKIKEKFYRQAIEEYEKRLGRYCKLKIVEVSDEKTPDHASDTETRQIKDKEGERLLRQIKDGTYLIALAIQGKKLDSVAFCDRRIFGAVGCSDQSGRLFIELFGHDISASAYACDFVRAGVSGISDHVERAVSQIVIRS